MKSNTIKTLFWCLFITLIKIFPDPNLKLDINKYIFPVVLIITLCLVHFIPKKTISISIGIIATGAMAFYSITYFVYALPIVLLYASHTCAVSQYETFKQKEKVFPFSTVFSFVSLLSLILQILYCQEAKTHTENTDSLGDLAYEIFYIALLVVLFIICVTDKSTYKRKISRKVTINFIFCYLFAIVCICVSVYNLIITSTSKTITHSVELNYWFIFIVMVIINNDPYFNILEEKFISTANRTIKNKVKK